ncbi:MAG: hypothetical protein KA998_05255 [Rickettsiaceae bacterium]|nr:hypothetical protein [Rickettsiaceae bacterium]
MKRKKHNHVSWIDEAKGLPLSREKIFSRRDEPSDEAREKRERKEVSQNIENAIINLECFQDDETLEYVAVSEFDYKKVGDYLDQMIITGRMEEDW